MFQFIQGGISRDHRGQIRFVNDFDMKDVRRFYIIKNSDLDLIRGWRAHKIEHRWFYVISGKFLLSIVKIDDWQSPNRELPIDEVILSAMENRMIYLPSGYGTAFRAMEEESEILVFANHKLDHLKFDDFTYDLNYFVNYNPS